MSVINIGSKEPGAGGILSNFTRSPFVVEIFGETCKCESFEGFWQGLKYEGEAR
jgi:hypothetical protein